MEGTMKQLLLMDKGGPWEMREIPIPTPGPGQILVKVLAASVCNQTDLNSIKALHPPHDHQNALMLPHDFRRMYNQLEGDPLAKYYNPVPYPRDPYPTPMGHEGVGEIVEIGPHPPPKEYKGRSDAPDFKIGDRVTFGGLEGGFGQYSVTASAGAVLIPDDVSNEEASLTEPAAILWGACRGIVRHNDVVCILGQGALGLWGTQWARIYGAKTIITSDPVSIKREYSKKFGADYVFDPTVHNITAEVDKITNGRGCDVVYECAGEPESVMNIPYLARFGAKVVQVGALCVPIVADWGYIHFKGLTVFSAEGAGEVAGFTSRDRRFAKALEAFNTEKKNGRLQIVEMITHRPEFSVEGVTALFKEIDEKRTVIKAVFDPWKV